MVLQNIPKVICSQEKQDSRERTPFNRYNIENVVDVVEHTHTFGVMGGMVW